jgi:hypothetical protein
VEPFGLNEQSEFLVHYTHFELKQKLPATQLLLVMHYTHTWLEEHTFPKVQSEEVRHYRHFELRHFLGATQLAFELQVGSIHLPPEHTFPEDEH